MTKAALLTSDSVRQHSRFAVYTAAMFTLRAGYDLFANNWFDSHKGMSNVLNKDFELYSSEADALKGANKWKFCNYDDPGVGFPRDCGKTGGIGGQWNNWENGRHGNGPKNIRYSIRRSDSASAGSPIRPAAAFLALLRTPDAA